MTKKFSPKDFADSIRTMADKIESEEYVVMNISVGVGDCLWLASDGQSAHSRTLSIEYRTDLHRNTAI